jgi:hypothetical protein
MALMNLTNYDDHPTEPNWVVFRFQDRGMAAEFQEGLRTAGILHEVDDDGPICLIGVKQRDRERAVHINYAVLGRHRKPFIGDTGLRYGLVGLFVVLLTLAIIGWMRS